MSIGVSPAPRPAAAIRARDPGAALAPSRPLLREPAPEDLAREPQVPLIPEEILREGVELVHREELHDVQDIMKQNIQDVLGRGERLDSVAAKSSSLRDASGKRIRGLFGVGLGFSDAEYTSGSSYAEAGFMPFAVRAGEIAEAVALRTPL